MGNRYKTWVCTNCGATKEIEAGLVAAACGDCGMGGDNLVEWMDYVNDPFWPAPRWFYRLWNRFMCRRGVHLLDEVISDEAERYLWCSSCTMSILVAEYSNQADG